VSDGVEEDSRARVPRETDQAREEGQSQGRWTESRKTNARVPAYGSGAARPRQGTLGFHSRSQRWTKLGKKVDVGLHNAATSAYG
jgi:hypothetical protein